MSWLRIKKRNLSEFLVLIIYIVPFLFALFFELLKLPTFIKYMLDVSWFLLLLTMIVRVRLLERITSRKMLTWIFLFFLYSLILYICKYQSIYYFLWGVRNNFRFYVFFFACIVFLKLDEVEDYMRVFDIAFYVNSIVVLIQFFVMGYRRDYLGGIFGTQHGCNGYMNIFLVIILTKSLLFYLHKRESIQKCILKIILIVMIAAFAELKFFFVEFAAVVIVAFLVTKFTWKKLLMIAISCFFLYFGVELLLNVFPEFEKVMSVQGLFESATSEHGYTSSGDMNRLTALSMSKELFLKSSEERLFGLGLGNCDYAEAYSFLTSPFYIENKNIHYTWLSTAFVFLEMGYVGLIFFFGFYVMLFGEVHRKERKGKCATVYCHIAKVLSIMCIVIAIYNSTLRIESAYMLYFVMAIPFFNTKEEGKRYCV